MNRSVVVDASLAVKWIVAEVDSDKADAVAMSWKQSGVRLVAPHLLPMEVANVLHRAVVDGKLVLDEAKRLMSRFLGSAVDLTYDSASHTRAMEIASELGQGAVYDSHYLALAELLNCELWTADERFYRATATNWPNVRWIGSI